VKLFNGITDLFLNTQVYPEHSFRYIKSPNKRVTIDISCTLSRLVLLIGMGYGPNLIFILHKQKRNFLDLCYIFLDIQHLFTQQ